MKLKIDVFLVPPFFLGYITCGQKPQEQECANGFFHCTVSKACVPNDQLCDLQDDCGDSSDEEAMECELTKQVWYCLFCYQNCSDLL